MAAARAPTLQTRRKVAGSARQRPCPAPPHGHRCAPHLPMRSHVRRGHAGRAAGVCLRDLRVPDGAPAVANVARLGCPRDDRRHWPRRYRSRQPDGAHSRGSLTWPSFDIHGSFGESCTLPMERFRWSGGSSRCQTRSARRSGGRGPAPTRRPPHRRRRTVLTTLPIQSQFRRIERVRV